MYDAKVFVKIPRDPCARKYINQEKAVAEYMKKYLSPIKNKKNCKRFNQLAIEDKVKDYDCQDETCLVVATSDCSSPRACMQLALPPSDQSDKHIILDKLDSDETMKTSSFTLDEERL